MGGGETKFAVGFIEKRVLDNAMKRTAVITGGGSGIGRAIALRLASGGCRVVILERDSESGAKVVAEVRATGGEAECVVADVSDLGSVRGAFEKVGVVDVLVNNAGIASVGNVINTSPEELDRLYSVNVKGVYHCLHVVVPGMVERGSGVILNLASIASKVGIADRFAYSMTKGAVLAMTLSVAKDFVGKGVRCNCICPGRVHTPFVDGFLEKNYPEDERAGMFQKLSEFQPMGRMGQPDEIAALAAFLCSDDAQFITGSAYDIDGGVTLLR